MPPRRSLGRRDSELARPLLEVALGALRSERADASSQELRKLLRALVALHCATCGADAVAVCAVVDYEIGRTAGPAHRAWKALMHQRRCECLAPAADVTPRAAPAAPVAFQQAAARQHAAAWAATHAGSEPGWAMPGVPLRLAKGPQFDVHVDAATRHRAAAAPVAIQQAAARHHAAASAAAHAGSEPGLAMPGVPLQVAQEPHFDAHVDAAARHRTAPPAPPPPAMHPAAARDVTDPPQPPPPPPPQRWHRRYDWR